MKTYTWGDILNALKKLTPKDQIKPILIGGGDVLFELTELPELLISEKPNTTLTSETIIKQFDKLKLSIQKEKCSIFFDKACIGTNKVLLELKSVQKKNKLGKNYTETTYIPIQDYLGSDDILPDTLDALDKFKEDSHTIANQLIEQKSEENIVSWRLVQPEEFVVFEILDGACITDEDKCRL